jgi:hypothetical protein
MSLVSQLSFQDGHSVWHHSALVKSSRPLGIVAFPSLSPYI